MTDDAIFGPPRSPRRRALGALLFLALLALVLLAIRRFGGQPAQPDSHDHAVMTGPDSARPVSLTAEEARRIGVTYAAVERGPLAHEVRVVGVVQADETRIRTVVSRLEGFVERLHVDRTGQPVRAGQTLLEMYAPMAVAAQQDLLLAHQLERDVANGTPDARASARSGLEAARQRLRQWEVPADVIARVEQGGTPSRTVPLRTPYGGFVLEKSVLEGQRVMAGDPLFRIADLSAVWLEGEVFEQDLPLLKVGTAVTATFQALPGEERTGRIAYVYPTLNPETRTARVRVELANRDLALKPGMYATLTFTGRSGGGLSVPRS
ncbi:MAG TPA: efflux RND transporter periplasmic adaptor subunit, partial [Gemmatimonadales bacterium]|nr:efflux RND transporter periplasmic adaptor subunit [Gemmatimonadales bacterium]